jgi:[ribosomal protein S5]-alanine N-acetyltransferase
MERVTSAARRIATDRLVLEPITPAIARAVAAGDSSALVVGDGWPHEDTRDAMVMAVADDAGPAWLITLGGRVIGDCGACSWPDASGAVEIGYGLAAPYRNRGYATEAAAALCAWLITQAGAVRITAVDVLGDNWSSRRVLEKLGFTVTGESDGGVSYVLTPRSLRSR